MRRTAVLTLSAALLARFAAPPVVHVHLIGDSTMADKPTPERNAEWGWGQVLYRYFNDQVVVHNHAMNGRSTKSFIDEGRWEAVRRELHAGDYVFIQFGHNDEKAEDTTRYTAPFTSYRQNLARFVTETRAAGATPVLFTPIARRKFDASGRLQPTHGDYPAAVRALAAEMHVPLVDLERSTSGLVQRAGPDSSKKLFVWIEPGAYAMYPAGRKDDTHLTQAGAMAVAGLAADALRASDVPLGKYVKTDAQRAPIRLWERAAPGALGDSEADVPTITRFDPPADKFNGTAVVIYPGGGYSHLSLEKEGSTVASWLNELGVTAFVVRYRLGPRYHHPVMEADAERAVRVVRANAAAWKLDPHRIGVMGFSAGGHMASTAETHFDGGLPASADPVERSSSRPDFAVLVYPVITMDSARAHQGSRLNLLGAAPDPALVRGASNETQVTASTPPTFLVATSDDATVPVENSVLFYRALVAARVPAELHLFETGRHGFGLSPSDSVLAAWLPLCESWMRRRGVLPAVPLPSRY